MRIVLTLFAMLLVQLQPALAERFPVSSPEAAINPKEGKKWEEKGVLLYEQGRFEECKLAMDQALIRIEKSRTALYYKALSNWRLGKPLLAITSLKEINEQYPAWEEGLHSLGYIYLGMGDLVSAKQSFEQALEIKPDYAVAWYHLGICNYQTHQLEAAKACLQSALIYQSDFPEANTALGMVFMDQKDYDQARLQINLALKGNSRLSRAWYLLALLDQKENIAEAISDIRKAIDIQPLPVYTSLLQQLEEQQSTASEITLTANQQN